MERATLDTADWFEVVLTTEDAQAASMTLAPGESIGGPDDVHAESDQWIYAISGRATAVVDGEDVPIETGDLVLLEAGEAHGLTAGEEPFEALRLYSPPLYPDRPE